MKMTRSISSTTVVVATPQQISSSLSDEAVILNLHDDTYYGLNPVGATVWGLIQQPQTIAAVRDAVVAEYQVDAARCEADLLELLAALEAVGLIEVRHAVALGGVNADGS